MAIYRESVKEKILNIALGELRRVHEHVSNSYDQLRIKALGMIAGEVAIVTFILAANDNSKIKINTVADGIFLGLGIAALLSAAALLISSITSGDWYIPGDMDEIEQIDNGVDNRYDNVEKLLLFLRKDYLEGTRQCIKIVTRRARRVNWGLYMLLSGSIILLVLKYGGRYIR